MEKQKNNVLMVPTDFSEVADFAVKHAIGIAKELNFKIALLHAINKETKSNLKKENKGLEHIEEKLKVLVDSIKQQGIEAESITKEGSIFNVIPEVAFEIGANFLIMGTHGKVGVQKFTGSYAWKVVTTSPVPIFVVQKREFEKGYHNIVFNIDHSMRSKQKLNWAVYIANIFKSTIHLTYPKESDEFIAKKIKANLSQTKSFLAKSNITFTEKEIRGGNLAKQLESYAKEVSADLFMIMTNPEKSNIILSPWDEKLLFNEEKIPVMCINPVDSFITVLRR